MVNFGLGTKINAKCKFKRSKAKIVYGLSEKIAILAFTKTLLVLKTFKMEATHGNDFKNPESKNPTIEIQVQCNTNDSGNENDGAILKKSDSVNSDDDIALSPLPTSIEETDKALDSAG